MAKSKIYACIGTPAFVIGCTMIHPGLGMAVSGLLLLMLSYIEFVEEEEEQEEKEGGE